MIEDTAPLLEPYWVNFLLVLAVSVAGLVLTFSLTRSRLLHVLVRIVACAAVAYFGMWVLFEKDWLVTFGPVQANAWQVAIVLMVVHAVVLFIVLFILSGRVSRRVRAAGQSKDFA